jgi:uncharacterized protein DUF5996
MTTAFPEDREHASYDAHAVERFWRALDWSGDVLEEFAGWFCGKQSPVHLSWHSLDLALTRFSGRRVPPPPDADPKATLLEFLESAYEAGAEAAGWNRAELVASGVGSTEPAQ